MTTALSLILALMLSIGGSPAGASGNTGIQAPIDNSCTINRIFEDYSQKTASRLFPKKIPEIVSIEQPKTQTRLIFTLPPKEKLLLMGYEDSMNLYQAFNMNPVNFTDPFGEDVLGSCSSSYQYFLNPSENRDIIKKQLRFNALAAEGVVNAALKTFLIPAKYLTLPARLMFGFDFDVNVNFTRDGSVIGGYLGKQNRLDIVKEQTVVFPLADFVTQTGQDVYFGLFYQGGNSSLGKSSRENLMRTSGSLGFNLLFWGNVSNSIINQTQATEILRNRVLRNIEESRNARASSNFSEYAKWDEIYQSVEQLDFSTAPGKAVFYAGPINKGLALDFAQRYGYSTIENTAGGQHLGSLNLFSTMSLSRVSEIWMRASEKFALRASGKVTLFLKGGSRQSIFWLVEEPALKLNYNVTKWQFRGY